jgi:lipopolysaccharide/colanic/teichoic acid biosynthesis glycosyltransferase
LSLIPLILDCEVSYCRGSSHPVSLLTLPLGTGTVLDDLVRRLEKVGHGEILVLSDRLQEADFPGESRSGPLPIRRVTFDTLPRELNRYEAGDRLLVVDSRLWPAQGYDFNECQRHLDSYRGATYVVAVGANGKRTRERVECDADGNVRRVQRLYAKNWSEITGTSIMYSIVPLRSVIGLRFVLPLELRAHLAAAGVLSQDLPRDCDAFRLGVEGGFLALAEQSVTEVCRQPGVDGFTARQPEVLLGRGCRIQGGVRLVPPLVIQRDCVIEEEATLIGPAVIGAGSRIMRGAAVVQSALAHGSTVPRGSIVRHRVVCGAYSGEASNPGVAEANCFDTMLPGAHGPRRGGSDDWGEARPARGRRVHCAIKRSMDVFLSATALLALSPLLLVVALLVKLGSRGPVFFAHAREGLAGREFSCWKFRTMVVGAHQQQRLLYKHSEVDGPQFKMTNDPRVTRVGKWLRATNIDELPQLCNVLLGHMSLVGPRPSPFRENQICVPWRRARLSVRPGITGLWQVCRGEDRIKGDFHEWIFYDMAYVRHFSIWLDLKILVATVLTLGGRWSAPFSWLVPGGGRAGHAHEHAVSWA